MKDEEVNVALDGLGVLDNIGVAHKIIIYPLKPIHHVHNVLHIYTHLPFAVCSSTLLSFGPLVHLHTTINTSSLAHHTIRQYASSPCTRILFLGV